MKHLLISKTAGLIAALLVASLAMPVLAMAAEWFTGVSYDASTKTVSGSVYADANLGNTVALDVYGDGDTPFDTVTSDTYREDSGFYYYDFQVNVADAVYSQYHFKYGSTVSDVVYRTTSGGTGGTGGTGGSGGGWGGGGGGAPVETSPYVDQDGNLNASALEQAFAGQDTVTVVIPGNIAIIPAELLIKLGTEAGKILEIKNDAGSYKLPLSLIDLKSLAEQLGVDQSDISIRLVMQPVEGDALDGMKSAAATGGLTIIGNPVEYKLTAESKDGKTEEITSFGNTYVERTLVLPDTADSAQATGVSYDPSSKQFSFVPSVFADADGKPIERLWRNSNSIYAVVKNARQAFADVPDTHWAKQDIELMADKLLLFGDSATVFAPDRNVTRAEFAAMIVRALGIDSTHVASSASYTDVQDSDRYADSVKLASAAGIVYGYPDGTFRPKQTISRQELVAMLVRALIFTDHSPLSVSDRISAFRDAGEAADWAVSDLNIAIELGIVQGMTNRILAPAGLTTRAQAAAMVKRFMSHVGFIDQ